MLVAFPAVQSGIWLHTPVQPHLPGLAGSPPQIFGDRQLLPQLSVLPQPSPAVPHSTP
jgi:hypothetical protein